MRDENGLVVRLEAPGFHFPRKWGYPTKPDPRDQQTKRLPRGKKRGCKLASTAEINRLHVSASNRSKLEALAEILVSAYEKPSRRQIRRRCFT